MERIEGPRRAGDPERLVADPSKAEAELGWRPRRSDLDTIVTTAWNYQLQMRQRSQGVA